MTKLGGVEFLLHVPHGLYTPSPVCQFLEDLTQTGEWAGPSYQLPARVGRVAISLLAAVAVHGRACTRGNDDYFTTSRGSTLPLKK